MDIIILMDYSNSLKQSHWKQQVVHAKNIVDTIVADFVKARVGLIRFGNKGYSDLGLTPVDLYPRIVEKLSILKKIYPAGGSHEWRRTDLGMKIAYEMFKQQGRTNASKATVILTNGYATMEGNKIVPKSEIKKAKSMLVSIGVLIHAVGFGFEKIKAESAKKLAIKFIHQIGSDKNHAVRITYAQLSSFIPPTTIKLCPAAGM